MNSNFGLWSGTVLFLMALLCGPGSAAARDEVTVSAAISLKGPFEEIGRVWVGTATEKKIYFNFGASGDLARQIEAGAPVDLFASAAAREMDVLEREGLIVRDTRVNFASNRMVLVTRAGMVSVSSFQDLKGSKVKRVALGNPATVPAGMYAQEVLKALGLLEPVGEKLILGENVRQVADYVARGEVDAAIVFATDAAARPKELRVAATAPETSHAPIVYPMAVVQSTRYATQAKSFIEIVLSEQGKAILIKHGFLLPASGK